MKNLFLAIKIPISSELEWAVDEIQGSFKFIDARWVELRNMHMTLKFFGPINESRQKKITSTLEQFFKNKEIFDITICKLAMFGSKGSPKTLWLGIEEEDFMKTLAADIQKELDKLGLFADRQNFVPHISMARISKTNSSSFFQKQLKNYRVISMDDLEIRSVFLLESIISKKSVEYKLVKEFKLR